MKAHLVAVWTLAALATSTVSLRAETPEETAFGLGQFTGAASFCKLPKDKVQEVAAALLTASGIDSSSPSPAMKRFTEGVTDGVKSMSAPDAASCADVTTAFNDAYDKVH